MAGPGRLSVLRTHGINTEVQTVPAAAFPPLGPTTLVLWAGKGRQGVPNTAGTPWGAVTSVGQRAGSGWHATS